MSLGTGFRLNDDFALAKSWHAGMTERSFSLLGQ
jgi:hypothetical protein